MEISEQVSFSQSNNCSKYLKVNHGTLLLKHINLLKIRNAT